MKYARLLKYIASFFFSLQSYEVTIIITPILQTRTGLESTHDIASGTELTSINSKAGLEPEVVWLLT